MRALLVLTLLLTSGAPRGDAKGAAVKHDPASRAQLENHLYEQTPMELAAQASAFLAQKGYAIADHADPLVFDTEWKDEPKGVRSRYHVQIVALSTERSQIQLKKISNDPLAGHADSGVDLDAAWTLLEKIEPAAAKKIADSAPAFQEAAPAASAAPSGKPTPRGRPAAAPTPIGISTVGPSVRATGTVKSPDATRVKGTTPAGGTADAKAAKYAKPAKTAAPAATPE